jgi:hypothetical protein
VCENDILVMGTSMMHNHAPAYYPPITHHSPTSIWGLAPQYTKVRQTHVHSVFFGNLHSDVEISTRRAIRPHIEETS